jgi:hypothetical protein
MMTMAGLGINTPVSLAARNGIVSMLAIWACGFSSGWGPLAYVITSEVASARLRDLTTRVGFGVNVVTNFLVSFSVPYLLSEKYANLQSKLGFIFGSIMAVGFVFVYFCVPECKGKTLEQVSYLFESGVPLRDFGKVDVQALLGAEMQSAAAKRVDGEEEERVEASHVDRPSEQKGV